MLKLDDLKLEIVEQHSPKADDVLIDVTDLREDVSGNQTQWFDKRGNLRAEEHLGMFRTLNTKGDPIYERNAISTTYYLKEGMLSHGESGWTLNGEPVTVLRTPEPEVDKEPETVG